MERTQSDLDHHANQLNPTSKEYQDAVDNRADQLNPDSPKYAGDDDDE